MWGFSLGNLGTACSNVKPFNEGIAHPTRGIEPERFGTRFRDRKLDHLETSGVRLHTEVWPVPRSNITGTREGAALSDKHPFKNHLNCKRSSSTLLHQNHPLRRREVWRLQRVEIDSGGKLQSPAVPPVPCQRMRSGSERPFNQYCDLLAEQVIDYE